MSPVPCAPTLTQEEENQALVESNRELQHALALQSEAARAAELAAAAEQVLQQAENARRLSNMYQVCADACCCVGKHVDGSLFVAWALFGHYCMQRKPNTVIIISRSASAPLLAVWT